jgi:hypothetical protein
MGYGRKVRQNIAQEMLEFGVINEEPDETAVWMDIAQRAIDGLSDLDTIGQNWTKLDIEVTPGGE